MWSARKRCESSAVKFFTQYLFKRDIVVQETSQSPLVVKMSIYVQQLMMDMRKYHDIETAPNMVHFLQ